MPINRQIKEKEVQVIDENGEKIGVLSLDAAIEKAEDRDLDLVLVMSVVPGKGGQSFMEVSLDKISYLDAYRKEHNLNYLIEVDGGINEQTSKLVKERNVDILVAGSFIIKSSDYKAQIDKLK